MTYFKNECTTESRRGTEKNCECHFDDLDVEQIQESSFLAKLQKVLVEHALVVVWNSERGVDESVMIRLDPLNLCSFLAVTTNSTVHSRGILSPH